MKVGYAYVVGDILHVEHLRHLRNCKKLCDKLIVGVLTDEATMEKKPRPTVPFLERMCMVEGIQWVDAVVAQTTYLPLNNILMLEPDILFEHEKHEVTHYPEFGGRVIVMPYSPGHSSTLIKEKIRGLKDVLLGVVFAAGYAYILVRGWLFERGSNGIV